MDITVQKSLSNTKWVFQDSDDKEVERIMRLHKLPEFVARLLNNRGVLANDVESYLFPSLKKDFPDPNSFKNMREMSEFLVSRIKNKKKIAIFGDFDVDGATSTALLCRFFREIGIETDFYIPDRLKEGYGPNIDALRKLKDKGADILLMVDCGTTSHDIVAQARDIGLEIIILDHHEAEDTLPDANFVINPKQQDDNSGLDMLAAVGVAFFVCVSLNAELRASGYYKDNRICEPSLKSWLDLVALGTVCDMVPLTGVNRLLVRRGFELMADTGNEGLKALIETSNISGEPKPYHAGFLLGPRINAGSRVHKSDLGARLLSTTDHEEALNLAWALDDCNKKRKSLQAEMLARAKNQVMAKKLDELPVIVIDDPDGHPGLAGLVAGQLARQFKKPACVITYAYSLSGEREGRGSGRSIPGINLAAAFIEARQNDILIKGGGHAMAGGFTIHPDMIQRFQEFMVANVEQQLAGNVPVTEMEIDGLLSVRGVRPDFIRLLENQAGPFGQGNPEPCFVLPHVRVERPDIVGQNHVRCLLADWEGGRRLKAVAFQSADTSLGQAILKNTGQPMHIAGQFKLDSWNGQERVEMHISDAAPAGASQDAENHNPAMAQV